MDHDEALAVLGVEAGAPLADVRAAYLGLLRSHHPDVAGAASTARAAAITEAYRVLSSSAREAAGVETETATETEAGAEGDTLVVALPAHEAFLALLDAAAAVGVVTYLDADAGLFEVIVEPDDGPTSSLVVTLQGRATGVTEAFCTLVAVGAGTAPPVEPYVARLAAAIRT